MSEERRRQVPNDAEDMDAAELLRLQHTNMSGMQQRLVTRVLEELEELRAGRVVPISADCPRCARIEKLFPDAAREAELHPLRVAQANIEKAVDEFTALFKGLMGEDG